MWKKNPDRYKREYFENADKLDTKYLRFGKESAERRENRELAIGEFTEYEIKVSMLGVPILSKVDFYDSINHIFEEDKTGKVPWTQAKVQKHEQLPFYAMALKHQTGVMPHKCTLVWIETAEVSDETEPFWAEVDKQVRETGKVVKFERYFDPREIERLEQDVLQVANEISDAYTKWISEI